MALAVATTRDLAIAPTEKAAPVLLPTPSAWPTYVPPTDPIIPVAPMIAPPPDGQFMGRGGTAFGSVPQLYIQPRVPTYDTPDAGYDLLPTRERGPVPMQPMKPPPPGSGAVMPVLTGDQPIKVPVAAAIQPVQKPGPISGLVAGFDLARVPLWAWLVGAALIGAKVLK